MNTRKDESDVLRRASARRRFVLPQHADRGMDADVCRATDRDAAGAATATGGAIAGLRAAAVPRSGAAADMGSAAGLVAALQGDVLKTPNGRWKGD